MLGIEKFITKEGSKFFLDLDECRVKLLNVSF